MNGWWEACVPKWNIGLAAHRFEARARRANLLALEM